ncbi:MAG: hypothetical protein IPP72_14480 [Chitinophagaceae bacterium]|nr:hypothetical protein [Chitinophagaceae bacterium]
MNPGKGEPYYGIYLCNTVTELQMEALNKAIQTEPTEGKYYEMRAYLYTSKGMYAERLADFKKWVLYDPHNGEAHAKLARALYKENPNDPEVKAHVKIAVQNLSDDNYELGLIKTNLPSLYVDVKAELAIEAGSIATEETVKPGQAAKTEQPAPKKGKQTKAAPSKKATPVSPEIAVDMESSQLADSCAAVFAEAIERWSGQMANRSDIITNFTACGSSDCRRNQFGALNELLAAMGNNISRNMYSVLYKNDARLGVCDPFAEKLRNAKWRLSESGDKYESAATFAINLKKDYNDYSSTQREQFIQLMFDAYDKADVAAQDGMKLLMDAYEIYLAKQCSTLKPGARLAEGNVVYQALAKAQNYLKFKLDAAGSEQKKNIAANEKKKKEAVSAAKNKTDEPAGNDVAGATKCKCCKGKGYISKQAGEFHKMSEKRVERVKRYVNGKAEIEVSYEPIGYTTYKTVKEKCTCCDGKGIK